jgi:aquaporin Z
MESKLRPYFAEFLGTFVFVLVAAGTVCASYRNATAQPALDLAGIALAAGCALAVALTFSTLDGPGGCLNPALTITFWVCKRLSGTRTLAFIGLQLAGAMLAGLLLRLSFGEATLTSSHLGTPHLPTFLEQDANLSFSSIFAGIGFEAAFTAIVAFAAFATLIDPRRPRQGGIGVGIAQIAVLLLGFNLTGGCANPARWFGTAVWQPTVPALSSGPFADHTVYWVGPVIGALFGGVIYTSLLLPPER